MSQPLAALALDGGDPREDALVGDRGYNVEALHLYNDPTVLLEEYMHHAEITRSIERQDKIANKQPFSFKGIIKNRFNKNNAQVTTPSSNAVFVPTSDGSLAGDEKKVVDRHGSGSDTTASPERMDMRVSDAEWYAASRAIRTATWSTIFYLITTDILGPFSVPWAFAQMGYGPGVALYTVFACMAGLSGWYIFQVFIHLDSDRYPLRDFGMAFFRVFGKPARHIVNVMQAIQMILTVSALILGNGQAISQVSDATRSSPICFIVCLLIFTLIGMVLGQIRTLQRFGWLANFAIWVNVLIIIFTMAVSAHSGPYITAVESSFGDAIADYSLPIQTFAGTPPAGFASGGSGFIGSMNGLNQAVYSVGPIPILFNVDCVDNC